MTEEKIINCPICETEGKIDFDLTTYKVRYCARCRFRWVEDTYPEEIIQSNGYYWGKSFYIENESYLRAKSREEIAGIMTLSSMNWKYKKWLDVGCSFGYLISEAKMAGFDTTGIEAVGEVAQAAKKREPLNIIHSLLGNIQLPAGSFDVITMMDVLEHLQDPKGAIARITALAKTGALLVIEVPYEDSLFRKISYFLYRLSGGRLSTLVRSAFHIHPGGHRLGFSKKALTRFLSAHGWNIVKVSKTMMPYKFFMSATVRRKNICAKLFWSVIVSVLYFISIISGLHNRIKIYARKKENTIS